MNKAIIIAAATFTLCFLVWRPPRALFPGVGGSDSSQGAPPASGGSTSSRPRLDLAPLAGAHPGDLPGCFHEAGGANNLGLYEFQKDGFRLSIRVDGDVIHRVTVDAFPEELTELPLADLLSQFGLHHKQTTDAAPIVVKGTATDPQDREWQFVASRKHRNREGYDILNFTLPGRSAGS